MSMSRIKVPNKSLLHELNNVLFVDGWYHTHLNCRTHRNSYERVRQLPTYTLVNDVHVGYRYSKVAILLKAFIASSLASFYTLPFKTGSRLKPAPV